MKLGLRIDPSGAAPIWRQLEEGVRRLVASGALPPGATVASVREVARELLINPATVAKAYQRLVDAGVLTVRRGEGTFVAEAPPPMKAAERQRLLREGAERFAGAALTLGATREEAAAALEDAFDSFDRKDSAASRGKR